MSFIAKIKGMFKKSVEIEVVSARDLVEKLKWAEVEVSDTKDALLGLEFRLQNGIHTMEVIAEDAQQIIAHHQEVLQKAHARRNEFMGHQSQVRQAVQVIENIYKED